ncbi:hypothetical protein [uncultured Corynebacterium sp.]|uniref:hypothetical protein n=1 Tax=uncultured Corynebacterium sp. TaxID=159447 RepID=UPI002598E695|nr:hypothetical protein [uncultured Corynebacterium sp.]
MNDKEKKARAKQLIADVGMFQRPKFTGASLIAANQLPEGEEIAGVFRGEKDGVNCLLIAGEEKVYIFGGGLKEMIDERIPYAQITDVAHGADRRGAFVEIREGSHEIRVEKSLARNGAEVAGVIRSRIGQ